MADMLDLQAQAFTDEEMETDEWKAIHQPWVLPYDKKVAAYKALMGCDYATILLASKGARELIAHGPEYNKMLGEMKTDVLALDNYVQGGQACGMQAMAVLSGHLRKRLLAPKNRPDTPPKSAAEAKQYASKLFADKNWGNAADMYMKAVELLTTRMRITSAICPSGKPNEPVSFTVHAMSDVKEDIELAPIIYANLAACRMKQHRWAEAIGACDESIKHKPTYTKAIVRRAQAKLRLRHYASSRSDAKLAIEAAEIEKDERLGLSLKGEAEVVLENIDKELATLAKDAARQELEEKGLLLGEGDPIFGRDFDHIVRRELRRTLIEPIVWIEELPINKIGMCRVVDPINVDGPEFLCEASVRSRGAKRYLYYNIDIAVEWRGICYEQGKTPHWIHDQFHGMVRMYNVTHFNQDMEHWGTYVTEKPVDPADVPTCTPAGFPIEPLIPLNPDGTVNTAPKKRCNETQELIFLKYGPELAKKLKKAVAKAIQGLRDYLGEYRTLPEDEEAAAIARAESERIAKEKAELEKIAKQKAKEQEDFIRSHAPREDKYIQEHEKERMERYEQLIEEEARRKGRIDAGGNHIDAAGNIVKRIGVESDDEDGPVLEEEEDGAKAFEEEEPEIIV